ncbi:MAG: bifunctional phosphopantothenoylcysteine decarboxylase/phosphopantothenate--cysteine ligase CoaBC [Lautropia sp.]|nr:MAG: bifunctional phosphopantothenoylcysteine decarboxylase/phosphopantothenate--cysteine ligase CoaBC [Pseudomonadota bacterium]MBC6958388.1 bifunctional phosphopantothenoylcysteine decarboxylase/phosphopantothenate--cysteine ligase CoaBC [Lautropia sp.]MCL4701367.1 bifunctional phosphopantothenoylcysteine decarboxylase/phosphopantothenate--cysteine ligase CoaBC [Burkholderiaceae bacterium]MCZ2414461.1 bifunctional phosphopantothenoylcysteine decarboxylase/phosphopantothenate--cysteine ligas
MVLEGKRILLGVTGGVAAYKAAELSRELQRAGARVQVVMTGAATRFVAPATFQALTGEPVFTDQWDARIANSMAHIELSRTADAILVAPATADFLAKAAHGLADDLLATLCLARECPLLVAPAMNRQMWLHPATQRNVAQLAADGVAVLGPESGEQACGETGLGRMLEPPALVDELADFLAPKPLAGRRVLLTAGPTFEPIDPVRGITNLSSGKMGFAIARACRAAGAQVTLVAGPVALATPRGVARIDVRTARQMHDAVMAALDATPRTDAFIAVAAVADWRVANPSERKLKKGGAHEAPKLEFAHNPDILATVARRPDAPWCVGFAAESEDLEANGQAKRIAKGVPLLVANIGHATFGRDDNELLLIDERGTRLLPRADKAQLARALVAEIAQRLPPR